MNIGGFQAVKGRNLRMMEFKFEMKEHREHENTLMITRMVEIGCMHPSRGV